MRILVDTHIFLWYAKERHKLSHDVLALFDDYEKSLAFYSQAQANAEIGLWDVVANRLYYSLFHAVSALLIKDKHKVGTHKGAVLMFGQHYVKTGVFPGSN